MHKRNRTNALQGLHGHTEHSGSFGLYQQTSNDFDPQIRGPLQAWKLETNYAPRQRLQNLGEDVSKEDLGLSPTHHQA